ncbi:ribosomal protein S5 domain 2-type protein [Phlyctochytrium arcticum]|nr:ribosomal protein S5 domain 2-type protein [Phlyctochytrium arcticum]
MFEILQAQIAEIWTYKNMAPRTEIISPEGLRNDGRRSTELRRLLSRTGVLTQADGSAYIEQGNTKCLAAVYGPREASKRGAVLHDRAIINVEYNIAAFSSGERKANSRRDRRLLEVASTIKRIFEAVIVTTSFPRSEIDIYLQILQIDGGAMHAAINAATLALIDAGIPMLDYVCACSAGWANNEPLLDLNYLEESADVPTLTVALLPKSGKVTMLGLESRLQIDKFELVMNLAAEGCKQLKENLDETVRKSIKDLAKTILH